MKVAYAVCLLRVRVRAAGARAHTHKLRTDTLDSEGFDDLSVLRKLIVIYIYDYTGQQAGESMAQRYLREVLHDA